MTSEKKSAAGLILAGAALTATIVVGVKNQNQIPVMPISEITKGATNPLVTQDTIKNTIAISGWAKTQRPPDDENWRARVKQVYQKYNVQYDPKNTEADHLIPIECGGAPNDVENNIWPEQLHINVNGLDEGAKSKDICENATKKAIVEGRITLTDAQTQLVKDWRVLYNKFVGNFPVYKESE